MGYLDTLDLTVPPCCREQVESSVEMKICAQYQDLCWTTGLVEGGFAIDIGFLVFRLGV